MDKVTEFINDILEHAGPPQPRIYDPVKAHQYYLKTRELKGRTGAGLKSKQQKEGWAYVKATVAEKKKNELQTLSFFNKLSMQKIRDDVAARRKELGAKIKSLDKNTSKEERTKLAAEFKDTIEKTRTEFKAAIEGIKAKYATQLDSEFNALKSMKAPKSSKSKPRH